MDTVILTGISKVIIAYKITFLFMDWISMHERIALIKTAWSDEYQGVPVLGRYANVKDGHERFNFLKHSNGRFYGYLPPIGRGERPPQPKEKDGWLLIFVSAKNGSGPLTVVGWYDNATLHEEYVERLDYSSKDGFERDLHGNKYCYCISADAGRLIPTVDRVHTVSGAHFKRSPVLYVRGNGKDESWRRELAKLAERVIIEPLGEVNNVPEVSFPDQEQRKLVEIAAIEAAKEYLDKNHIVTDRQKDNCGYDLLACHKKTSNEFHVEVKGTSGFNMHFYMSRNEFRYMSDPRWRLIMVTDALKKPQISFMSAADVARIFNTDPFAWEATPRKNNQ